MTAVCVDESIFVYDYVIQKVRAMKETRPVVLTTSSHKKKTHISGSVSTNRRQLFRHAESINSTEFIKYLKTLKRKFRKFIPPLNRTTCNRSEIAKEFLE